MPDHGRRTGIRDVQTYASPSRRSVAAGLASAPTGVCSVSVATPSVKSLGSVAETREIRIAVVPQFVPEESDPRELKYVFSYRVRITNNSQTPVKLLNRRWRIVDAHGGEQEARGEGVVGQQPRLEAGQSFEYSSWCPLRTSWGTMEGFYTFATDSGEKFDARIERFFLVYPKDQRR